MKNIRLYNTLTKRVEELEPLGEEVKMFVCGPTVYDLSHVGHAKTYIQMDVLARTLRQAGYKLFYLQNITDIDDKIIDRAGEQKTDWQELRSSFEEKYYQDMEALGISSVDEYARATDYIEDIIKQLEVLIDKGHAYEIEGDGIYFEIETFSEYGKLSGRRDFKANDAQSRIDESDKKRGWNDFCLWKFSKADEPVWDAPFGKGRPGWHIEDTAITESHFGPQYDIHGGAIDLIFPHHEAEITQMESISGLKPFVRYWVHSGFLNLKGDKMSKSLGNFVTIRDVLERGYDPKALRLLMLQSHYRSSMDFSWELLDAADTRLRELRSVADLRWQPVDESTASDHLDFTGYIQSFMDKMVDDIDTPKALADLSINFNAIAGHLITKEQRQQFIDYLEVLDSVLGLGLLDSSDIDNKQKELLESRAKARSSGDYDKSDQLRNELEEQGLEVRDTPAGQIWARS